MQTQPVSPKRDFASIRGRLPAVFRFCRLDVTRWERLPSLARRKLTENSSLLQTAALPRRQADPSQRTAARFDWIERLSECALGLLERLVVAESNRIQHDSFRSSQPQSVERRARVRESRT